MEKLISSYKEELNLSTMLWISIFCLLVICLLSFWTDRNLDYLGQWIQGNNTFNLPYWVSFIATVVLNGVTFAFNVIMEIIRLIRG